MNHEKGWSLAHCRFARLTLVENKEIIIATSYHVRVWERRCDRPYPGLATGARNLARYYIHLHYLNSKYFTTTQIPTHGEKPEKVGVQCIFLCCYISLLLSLFVVADTRADTAVAVWNVHYTYCWRRSAEVLITMSSSSSSPPLPFRTHRMDEWVEDQRDYVDADRSRRPLQPGDSLRKRKRSPPKSHVGFRPLTDPDPPISAVPPRNSMKSINHRLGLLGISSPKVFFGQPYRSEAATLTETEPVIPPLVSNLIREFSQEAANPSLPRNVLSRIGMMSPTEAFPAVTEYPRPSRESEKLFGHVSNLFYAALLLQRSNSDQSSWYNLTRMVLSGTLGDLIEVGEAQTKVLCYNLLPKHNGDTLPSAKVDHLLQFNPWHSRIEPKLMSVFQWQTPAFSVSAFNESDEPLTPRTFTCAIVVVKAPSNTLDEANYQFAITSAAILEKLSLMDFDSGYVPETQDYMPVIGWIVYGHYWSLYMSYQQADGSIVCSHNPFPFVFVSANLTLIESPRPVSVWKHCNIPRYISSCSNRWEGQDLGRREIPPIPISQTDAVESIRAGTAIHLSLIVSCIFWCYSWTLSNSFKR